MSDRDQEMNRNEEPLSSWKEIAGYLERNSATVRRWEKQEGLPVHRHGHQRGSTVYAYPSELDAWRASRRVPVEQPVVPWWRRRFAVMHSLAFGTTLGLCLIMVGNGLRPQTAF